MPASIAWTLDKMFARCVPEPNSGCWLWDGAWMSGGYGNVKVKGRAMTAHRLAFQLAGGDGEERDICHRCDTPSCCNPDHLFAATHQENMRDALQKQRWRNLKLTAKQALNIRADTRSAREIAVDYGVVDDTVRNIKSGHTWKHLWQAAQEG
jgi:hypothetical protein